MDTPRPLDGIKVLGITRVYAAPFAAYQLALNGAEVINIEMPGSGDTARTTGAEHGKALIDQQMSANFLAHAAGKKSITLNLRSPEGVEIFRKLAEKADVLMENLRTGSMDALGLGYQDIRAVNPGIVYCSLTGYGQTGPKRRDAAIDPVIQAASGLMSITGKPESGPTRVGTQVIDYAAGLVMINGILTALLHRQRTGQGQHVDVSMLETALSIMSATVSDVMNGGANPGLLGNGSANNLHVSDVFECGDHRYILIAATHENRRQRLWKALDRMDIPRDPRFVDMSAMRANAQALTQEVARTTMTRSAAEWEAILNEAGVPCMKVNTIAEIVRHPQIRERGYFQEFDNIPGVDCKVDLPLAPFKLSETPPRIDFPPPRLGQHTAEVLESIGYEAREIARLRAEGVI